MDNLITPTDVILGLLTNVAAITTVAWVIYYRRHRRRDLAFVFWFFNICLFVAVAVMQMTEAATALGFGLFAILSIIRLRSEPFNNRELGYFFGALVIGLLNGVGTTDRWFTLLLNVLLILSIFVLDHPRLLPPESGRIPVRLDRIYTDRSALEAEIERRLDIAVSQIEVVAIDFVRDSMDVEVTTLGGVRAASPAPVPYPFLG